MRQLNLLAYAIIGVGCLMAYGNILNTPFLFDDQPQIVENPLIRDLGNFIHLELWLNPNLRPVSFLSLAIDFHFSGLNPLGYHITNLALHLIFSFLCFGFARTIIKQTFPALSENTVCGSALFVGAICALHPLQTQAVTYVVQRMTVLAGIGYIGACWAFLSARLSHMEKGWGGAAVLQYALAILLMYFGPMSKQNAVTIPLAFVLLEYFFVRNSKGKSTKWILVGIPITCICLAILVTVNLDLVSTDSQLISRESYFATQTLVLFHYFKMMLLPIGQNIDHDFQPVPGIGGPLVLLAAVLHIGILFTAWHLRKREKLVSLGILWIYLALSIESSIIPIRDAMVEHRLYVPLFGFALLGATLLLKIKLPRLRWAIMGGLIVVAGIFTYNRNKVWGSAISLWADAVEKSPQKSRPHSALGRAYFDIGELEKAEEFLEKAIVLDPSNAKALNQLGLMKYNEGKIEEAIAYYQKSLQMMPQNPEALINIGLAWEEIGVHPEAIRHYRLAARYRPFNARVYFNLGNVLMNDGRYAEAVEEYKKAISIDPEYAKAFYNLGNTYYNMGREQDAITAYEKAVDIQPNFAMAWNNLGNMHFLTGKKEEAVKCYQQALKYDPDNEQAVVNLGLLIQ